MMMRARVLTPWAGAGTEASPYRPRLGDDHPVAWALDVTGQPAGSIVPSPNAFTVEVVCTDAVLQQIEQDATYSVLWSETT